MIRISLSEEEEKQLLEVRRVQTSKNIGERAFYVLLSNEGKSVSQIASITRRNEHTIRLWLSRYIKEGLSGLNTKISPGRPAKKAPIIETHLEELLSKTPADYGYQEAGWQINLLRDWFSKRGLEACENTIVKSLNRLGFVYKRFSKTLPKNAPSSEEKKTHISEMVNNIAQYPSTDIEILFVDETHFSNQPYVQRGWFKKGEKKQRILKKSD